MTKRNDTLTETNWFFVQSTKFFCQICDTFKTEKWGIESVELIYIIYLKLGSQISSFGFLDVPEVHVNECKRNLLLLERFFFQAVKI